VLPFPLLIVGLSFAAPGRLACGELTGFTPAILELTNACGPALERLGTPLSFSPVGGGLGGNYLSGQEAGEGIAYGALVVQGPKASARVDYQLSKGLGVWTPSVLLLSFDDGAKLDVKACAAERIQQRGAEATRSTLERRCMEGQAELCQALAQLRGAAGDVEGAAKARAQACALGLKSACPAP
jgi:hypothetical protein